MAANKFPSIISSPFTLIGLLVLLIALVSTSARLLLPQATPYTLERTDVNGTVEQRFKFNGRHFMTLVDENGTFNLRPNAGCDVNGWGSSWYAQPFLPRAVLKHTVIDTLHASADGVHVVASGSVSRDLSSTYGTWGMTLDFNYDPTERSITGTGLYTIALPGPLSETTGDLNLYKIASNYLDDVPLLTGRIGDTGDMGWAYVMGDRFDFTWIPPNQPSYFPMGETDSLSIDVSGKYNDVDTGKMGYDRIEPAFKSSLKVVLTSQQPGTGMVFGGFYDLAGSRTYWEDNVGITPLIRKTSTRTQFSFHVAFESKEKESCSD